MEMNALNGMIMVAWLSDLIRHLSAGVKGVKEQAFMCIHGIFIVCLCCSSFTCAIIMS